MWYEVEGFSIVFFSMDIQLTQHCLLRILSLPRGTAVASSSIRCPWICLSAHIYLFYSSPQPFLRWGVCTQDSCLSSADIWPETGWSWETSVLGVNPVDFVIWQICISASVVVQLFSHVRLFATPWTAAHQASLSFTISQSLLKLMSIELVIPSNHPTLCHPFLLLLSIFPSIKAFSVFGMRLKTSWLTSLSLITNV